MTARAQVLGFSLIVLAILTSGCTGNGSGEPPPAAKRSDAKQLSVHVVNYPLQYFAQRIGGDLVHVEFPAPGGIDPAFWRPAAEEVSGYQKADLVLLNGAGYAKWLSSVSLRSSSLIDTSAGFADLLVAVDDLETHSHGPQGEHEHGGFAFTTWLDPQLALRQARAVEAAFRDALPAGSEKFRSGLESLERDLLDLDRVLREIVDRRNIPLLGSHPVYQYLARGYALQIDSVHFEPDEFPEDASWRELQLRLKKQPAAWMLWEGSPLDRTAQRLRELGVGSVVFDPCGNRPDTGDYLSVQRANLENLRQIYGAGS